jgi:hemerythrin-like metal-binding protein
MEFIEWTDSLSVGIKSVDDQHKRFIKMINSARAASMKKALLFSQVSELLEYARVHFSTEEEIFDKYSYPNAREHKIEHVKLIEKAISFYDRSKAGKDVTEEFLLFLKDWLENHLKDHDFRYAKFFRESGIKIS